MNGPVISSISFSAKGGNQKDWEEISVPLNKTEGVNDLYFVFTGEEGKEQVLAEIDWIYFSNKNRNQ